VVVTGAGTVVVVVRTTADLATRDVDVVVVVDTTATGAPAIAMLVVVVVGAMVATDAWP
jgi:hypothetical protein